ncbi:MAG: CRISPR-associated endonuclease Cas1, partial [Limnohabitans sp.]
MREDAADRLSRLCRQDAQGDLDVLRGIEGAGAAAYFGAFDAMIKHPAPEFRFHTRTRRPPKDRVNAMLSFGYTL